MPKKPPRNAFYFYMLDFKEEQRKKGIQYNNMAAVAEAAGPAWRDAPPPVRTKFEAMAKREKQKTNVPEMKFTSTGVSFAEIERRQKEQQEAIEREQRDIVNKVKSKAVSGGIKDEDIYLMDVNCYCRTASGYVICESTLLRFNLADGIQDDYHEIVNPGAIPIGYGSDAKLACVEFGLEMPDESKLRTNYIQMLANIMDYLRAKDPSNSNALPIIYTLPDKVAPVQDFIQQLCSISAQDDEARFRVYRLDTLFYNLINAIKSCDDEGFPKESLALMQLRKDTFKYNPGLGCDYHENETEKSVECTRSRVKRWAYTILDHCCPVAGIEMCPGKHVPLEYDMERILVYKEQASERAAPSVAMPSCNSSMVSDSFETSNAWSTATESVVSGKRTPAAHTQGSVREPKINYASRIREAPNLSESDFPKLSISVGRGRGSANRLNK